MIETVDARADIGRASGLAGWDYARSTRGVCSWSLPASARPPGLSLLRVTDDPAGRRRVRVEANLTAVLYGPQAATGSLEWDEVGRARDGLLGLVTAVLPGAPDDPEAWDVHRLDPSATVVVPVPAGQAVQHAAGVWSVMCTGRQAVSLTSSCGRTAVWRRTAGLSWSVYDKAAEAAASGKARPVLADGSGLLRAEVRCRPRKSRAEGAWRPTLTLSGRDEDMTQGHLSALLESLSRPTADGVLTWVAVLKSGGASDSQAWRLASAAYAMAAAGESILEESGVPGRTSRRWRAELRELVAAAGGEDAYLAAAEQVSGRAAVLLARDLVAAVEAEEQDQDQDQDQDEDEDQEDDDGSAGLG